MGVHRSFVLSSVALALLTRPGRGQVGCAKAVVVGQCSIGLQPDPLEGIAARGVMGHRVRVQGWRCVPGGEMPGTSSWASGRYSCSVLGGQALVSSIEVQCSGLGYNRLGCWIRCSVPM